VKAIKGIESIDNLVRRCNQNYGREITPKLRWIEKIIKLKWKSYYENKTRTHIHPVKKNPIKNLEKNLNSIIKKWWKNGHITKQTYLSCSPVTQIFQRHTDYQKSTKKTSLFES